MKRSEILTAIEPILMSCYAYSHIKEFNEETRLFKDKSETQLFLLMELEEVMAIDFSDDEAEGLSNVGELVSLIESKVNS